jgi:hypothetical protein
MRFNRFMIVLAVFALLLAGFSSVQADDTPLGKAMEQINDGYKALRKAARAKEFTDESVKIVNTMAQASIAAMIEVPPMIKDVPAAQQEKFLLDYKKSMKEFTIALMDIQLALAEKQNDKAAEMIDKLAAHKKDGHEKFTKED